MLKDSLGQIWLGTWDAGLNLWIGDSSFVRFKHQPENPMTLSSDSITFMKEDQRGFIWVGTSRGLNRLNLVTKEITRVPFPSFNHPRVVKIFIDSSGKLWIATGDGMVHTYDLGVIGYRILQDYEVMIDYTTKELTFFQLDKKGNRLSNSSFFSEPTYIIPLKLRSHFPF